MSLSHVYKAIRYKYHYVGLIVESARDLSFNLFFCYSMTFAYFAIGSDRHESLMVFTTAVSVTSAMLFLLTMKNNIRVYDELYEIAKDDKTIRNRLQNHEIDQEDYYKWVAMEAFTELQKKVDKEFREGNPKLDSLYKIIHVWQITMIIFMIIKVSSYML